MSDVKQAGGCTWPEQDAVEAWVKKHGLQIDFHKLMELKEAVTAYRITRDRDHDRIVKELREENEALKHDIERHVQITSEQANEVEALRVENARLRNWNERVRVCKNHTAAAVDGDCLVCTAEQAKAALLAYQQEAVRVCEQTQHENTMTVEEDDAYDQAKRDCTDALRNLPIRHRAEAIGRVLEQVRLHYGGGQCGCSICSAWRQLNESERQHKGAV